MVGGAGVVAGDGEGCETVAAVVRLGVGFVGSCGVGSWGGGCSCGESLIACWGCDEGCGDSGVTGGKTE